MKQVAAKFVPRVLTEDQKQSRNERQLLTKNDMTPLTHPPYSPDLAPCDLSLFPRMKKDLKGNRFVDVDEVKEKTTMALQGITLQEFQGCFERWKTRLDRCIASKGEYFEGDMSDDV